MVIKRSLTDFSIQKNEIITSIKNKILTGVYNKKCHDSFKPSNIIIEDVELIINSIESNLRKIEVIYYTYFYSGYDPKIILNNSMPTTDTLMINKVIETEFNFGINVLKNRIDINNPSLYKEIIDTNFQTFILTTSSIYEVIVKLCEIILKKIVIYDGEKSPYQSISLKLFIMNWDRLVELGYRKKDIFYMCFFNYRNFIDKYLIFINTLRNKYIHGYSINLEINRINNEYMIKNVDQIRFPSVRNGVIEELIVKNFLEKVWTDTYSLTKEVLNLFVSKLSRGNRKFPM